MFRLAELARSPSWMPCFFPEPFATTAEVTWLTFQPLQKFHPHSWTTCNTFEIQFRIPTRSRAQLPHPTHCRCSTEYCPSCREVDMTSQCRTSAGSKATKDCLEFTRGRAWKCSVPSAPCISFWEGGICSRASCCLGPFSLVILLLDLAHFHMYLYH